MPTILMALLWQGYLLSVKGGWCLFRQVWGMDVPVRATLNCYLWTCTRAVPKIQVKASWAHTSDEDKVERMDEFK